MPATEPLHPDRLGLHLDRLTRVARRLTGSREAADDLVQDTLERVLRKPRRISGDELAYLTSALRRTHISRVRAARARIAAHPLPEGAEVPDARTEHGPATAIHAREVLSAVASLPAPYRDAVVAVDVWGCSYDEAATALATPRGTVQSRAFRGRARVARAVGDAGLLPGAPPVY